MKIIVRTLAGKSISVDVEPDCTVQALKVRLEREGLQPNALQLCIGGKKMEDDRLLSAYNVSERVPILALRKPDSMDLAKAEESPPAPTVRCLGGCGFWGNPKTDNYCSKCFANRHKSPPAASAQSPSQLHDQPQSQPPLQPQPSSQPQLHLPPVAAPPPASAPINIVPASSSNGNAGLKMSSSAPPHDGDSMDLDGSNAPDSSNSLGTSPVSMPSSSPGGGGVHADVSRCWECKKKVGLLGIKCRCGYTFCSKHRYPEDHRCNFDFKARERDLLKQRLEKVAGEKITKI